ncbi:hypothetical protein ACEE21_06790 [Clostridium baratii]
MNRDSMIQSNSGVKSQYEFTNIFKNFGTNSDETDPNPENSKPVISGANDITINLGETFNPLKGITANDK